MKPFSLLAALLWSGVTIMHIAFPEGTHAPIWAYSGLLALIYFNGAVSADERKR
jgi:hypothetical protein